MTFKYFHIDTNTTIEDVKKQRDDLAKKHHPDKGGKTEIMQEINAEFQKALVKVAKIPRNKEAIEMIDKLQGVGKEFSSNYINSKLKVSDDIKKVLVELSGIGINKLSDFIKDKLIQ